VELKDLEGVITRAKKEFHLDGIVTGALYSKYQSERIQKICSKLGLRCYSPLWHVSQAFEMRWVAQELEAVIGAIAALGLKKELLGKRIDGGLIDRLLALHKKYGINVAGEGGEFESLVLDGPMFRKRIVIEDYELKMSDENTGRMLVKRAVMVNKK